jgi:hypothetical protein
MVNVNTNPTVLVWLILGLPGIEGATTFLTATSAMPVPLVPVSLQQFVTVAGKLVTFGLGVWPKAAQLNGTLGTVELVFPHVGWNSVQQFSGEIGNEYEAGLYAKPGGQFWNVVFGLVTGKMLPHVPTLQHFRSDGGPSLVMLKSNSVLFGHFQGLLGFVDGVGLEHVFFRQQLTTLGGCVVLRVGSNS